MSGVKLTKADRRDLLALKEKGPLWRGVPLGEDVDLHRYREAGWIVWNGETIGWSITPAGRLALSSPEPRK